jgi:hypothetical protein
LDNTGDGENRRTRKVCVSDEIPAFLKALAAVSVGAPVMMMRFPTSIGMNPDVTTFPKLSST